MVYTPIVSQNLLIRTYHEGDKMLNLRGTDYGNVFCAPGALGFFGEGYPYHKVAKMLGMTWQGTGFVSKTVVYPPREGNMPFRADKLTPSERLMPRSVVVKPFSGHVLNAIGLSGPGAEWAFGTGRWQDRTEPFMISFMSVAGSVDERLVETRMFVELFQTHLPKFRTKVAIQANRACPNTGHPPEEFYEETTAMLDILAELGIPIVVNYNPTVPGEVMVATASHEACDALWIANTIPWGDPRIDWRNIFDSNESPLAKRGLPVPGGGGLSGPACLPHARGRVLEARRLGIKKPIVAGNGIQRARDVRRLREAGANAVTIGCVGMVRPWRMRSIIATANSYD